MDAETQKQIDDAVSKATAKIAAEYEARGKWFRNWIVANPLPAARVIGSVCLMVGGFAVYLVMRIF